MEERPEDAGDVQQPAMQRTRRRWRVLVAEDSPFNQALTIGLLERWGHEVAVANSLVEAIGALQASEFDLALMDMQMPGMDAVEATKAIRQREKQTGKHLPIIAMAAGDVAGDRERCLEAGMDAYVAKPVHAQELLAAIDSVLTAHGEIENQVRSEDETKEDQVDWEEALQAVNGRRELLAELVEIFFTEYPGLLVDIHRAIEKQDAGELKLFAHRLKGCLRYFGKSSAAERALELEEMGRGGRIAEAEAKFGELEAAMDRLLPSLRKLT